MQNKFLKRDLPKQLIKQQINKAHNLNRIETLTYKPKYQKKDFLKYTNNKPFLPLIITYDFKFNFQNVLINKLTTLWKTNIQESIKLSQAFLNIFPKIIYKRGKTIANNLVSTKYFSTNKLNLDSQDKANIQIFTELLEENSSTYTYNITPCNHPLCKCCYHIYNLNHIKSINYTIKNNITCNTKCNKKYIGQTKRMLKDRLNNHRSDILNKKNTAVGIHFNSLHHNTSDLKITPLEIISKTEEDNRLILEKSWIKLLKTNYPYGLNYYPIIT